MGEFIVYNKSRFKERYTYKSGDYELKFTINYTLETVSFSIDCDEEFMIEAWRFAKELINNYKLEI